MHLEPDTAMYVAMRNSNPNWAAYNEGGDSIEPFYIHIIEVHVKHVEMIEEHSTVVLSNNY